MDTEEKNLCVDIYNNMSFGKKESDDSAAAEWLGEQKYFYCWIDGNYVKPKSRNSYSTIKLGDAECLVPDGIYAAEAAVNSSIKAQSGWMKWSLLQRVSVLHKILKELQRKRKLFSNLFELQGQQDDSELFLDYFNFYSNTLNFESKNMKPAGVVLVILSYDTPAWFSAATSAAALWAGCSLIIKPVETAPFFPFLLAETASTAGLPDGLINVVPGSQYVEDYISSVGVFKIVFGGDYFERCVNNTFLNSDLLLFQFGHASSIIFESCDLDGAADKLYSEIRNSSQQSPWKVDLILVQETISEVFLSKLTRQMKAIKSGDNSKFSDKSKEFGIEKILMEAETVGAEIFAVNDNSGSEQILITEYEIDTSESNAYITTLLIFKTVKEALDIVNNRPYYLGTSVWTENLAQSLEVSSKLETSTVWINCHGIMDASVPFEVSRRSGTGVLGGLDGGLVYTTQETDNKKMFDNKDRSILENMHSELVKEIVAKSRSGFMEWKCSTNRKEILLNIADEIERTHTPEYSNNDLSSIINFWALNGNSYEITMSTIKENLHVTQCKKPIGVIEMVLNDYEDSAETFISWVTPAVAMGNVAIVVLDEMLFLRLEAVIQCFIRNLPCGVLEIIKGINNARQLASDSNIESVWLKDENYPVLGEKYSAYKRKRIWSPPSPVPLCKTMFAKHCLKNQVVWFPAIFSSDL